MSTRSQCLCALPILLISVAGLLAQTPSAVVNGTVTDPSGAGVPDARVTVTNQDTNVHSSQSTGADGTFTGVNLLPGKVMWSASPSRASRISRSPRSNWM